MASMRDGGSILKHRATLCLAGARIHEIERQTGVTELVLNSKDSYGKDGESGKGNTCCTSMENDRFI